MKELLLQVVGKRAKERETQLHASESAKARKSPKIVRRYAETRWAPLPLVLPTPHKSLLHLSALLDASDGLLDVHGGTPIAPSFRQRGIPLTGIEVLQVYSENPASVHLGKGD